MVVLAAIVQWIMGNEWMNERIQTQTVFWPFKSIPSCVAVPPTVPEG